MHRRQFLTVTTAAAATSLLPSATVAEPIDYVPGLLNKRLSQGETVFLEFTATWCVTCAAQKRVIDALFAQNPAYERELTYITADWDRYGRSNLVRSLRVPRRSTLMILKGEQEYDRLIAQTSRRRIKRLLDIGLATARA